MTLTEELQWRGQIKETTFDDIKRLDETRTFYLGSDCSSNSLTIGNLAVYMLARRLRKHGWKAVMLVGGATSLIGDPGGKQEERELKSREEIQANVKGIAGQIKQLFNGMDFTLVDNYDWLKEVGYLEFLRDVGKHYSMTELLQRDFIVSRIGKGGSGISYAEFSYSLIQGYDYWHLFKNCGVELQIGGSDQWGNMLSGVALIRKKENRETHALSMPLVINKSTGKKFGKSEQGTIWLDADKTSVYKFYQFWLNMDDEGCETYLKIYTELDKPEINAVMVEFNQDRSTRIAQKRLAFEATKIVHGEKRAEAARRVSDALFGSGDYAALQASDVELLSSELPTIDVNPGDTLIAPLVSSKLALSNSQARRFLEQGAVYVSGRLASVDHTFTSADTFDGEHMVLRKGKNAHALLRLR